MQDSSRASETPSFPDGPKADLAADAAPAALQPLPWWHRMRLSLCWVSLATAGFFALIYLTRPDGLAALTALPIWIWAIPGLLIALFSLSERVANYGVGAAVVAWLACGLIFADELRSLSRFEPWPQKGWYDAWSNGQSLRVLSLNCDGHDPRTVLDVALYNPDLILFQEVPERGQAEDLGQRLFGEDAGVAYSGGLGLIARGTVTPTKLPDNLKDIVTQAHVVLVTGHEIEVFSLNLDDSSLRFDLWTPSSWSAQSAGRKTRRTQLQRVLSRAEKIPSSVPLVIGGSFNAPQGDPLYRTMPTRLRDPFYGEGQGWCDTFPASFPLVRVDQIWAERALGCTTVLTRGTRNSDHRVVVADLILGPGPKSAQEARERARRIRRGIKKN